MGSGKLLHKAYQKYGLECFKKEILQFYNGDDELNQGEIYWIAKFNSTDHKIGYNLTYGGDGGAAHKGHQHTVETKRKMSEAHRGENNGFFGKHHNEDARRKMSEAKKGKQIWLGKTHSDETKRKVSESIKLYWQKQKLEKLNKQNNG